MLGVMTVRKEELKIREYDRYALSTADCAERSASAADRYAASRSALK